MRTPAWCGAGGALLCALGCGGVVAPEHRLDFASDNDGTDVSMIFDRMAKREPTWQGRADVDHFGDGLRFGFVEPLHVDELHLISCRNGGPADVVVYVDGTEAGRARVEPRSPDWRDWGPMDEPTIVPIGRTLQTLVLSFEGPVVAPSACVHALDLMADGKRIGVSPPRSVTAIESEASGPARSTGYAFDEQIDRGWLVGSEGPGLGHYLEASLALPLEVHAVQIWSTHAGEEASGAPLPLGLSVDGGRTIPLGVAGWAAGQKIALTEPVVGSTFRFVVGDAETAGDAGLALREIALWDADGPLELFVTLDPTAPPDRHPVTDAGDRWLVDACVGHRRGLKLRRSRSFVYVERATDAPDGLFTLIYDGSWGEGPGNRTWAGVELGGRERVGEGLPYYFETTDDAYDMSGARHDRMQIALATEVSASTWGAAVGALDGCPAALDHADMVAAGALVVRHSALEGVFVPRPLHADELAHQFHEIDLEVPGEGTFDCRGTKWPIEGTAARLSIPEAELAECAFVRGDATAPVFIVPDATREKVVCAGAGADLRCAQLPGD